MLVNWHDHFIGHLKAVRDNDDEEEEGDDCTVTETAM